MKQGKGGEKFFVGVDYADMLMHAPIGIFTSTPEGRFVEANHALARMYGYASPRELIDSITDIARQAYVDAGGRELFQRRLRAEGEIFDTEACLRRKDGSLLWVSESVRAVFDRQGNISHYQGFSRDITARKEALSTLKQREEQYHELIENAPVGIFQITPAGRFLSANPEYARLVGYATAEELVSEVSDIASQLYVNPADRERYKEQLRQHGEAKNFEVQLKRRNGEKFWVSINSRLKTTSTGEIVFDGFLVDISERKRAEEERLKIRGAADPGPEDGVGGAAGRRVAHDFNNMLGVILGYSRTAPRPDRPQPRQICPAMQGIQQAATRSAELTGQLLAFARKQTVAPKILDLNRTVAGMLQMLRRLIGEDIDLVWRPGRGTRRSDQD
jgi:two-component system, cell cycle sensor histidine kinase and response regulator CckA